RPSRCAVRTRPRPRPSKRSPGAWSSGWVPRRRSGPCRPSPEPGMASAAGSAIVPIFPLPDVTFFPRTLLPLHVFEARYRAMVMDALARDRRLCVVKLQPGFDQASYLGKPAVHPVAGAGEIVSWERLATGRYNILVKGEWRI